LYYGLPLLYNKYVKPVEQNTAGLTELQSQQKQTSQELADLQSRLKAVEAGQKQDADALSKLDGRVSDLETQIAAHTKSLAALERMQSELQEQDEATSAELQRQINVLKAMELLSRARLFMYQSNFGLARQDIQIARDLLAEVQKDASKDSAGDLEAVVRRLDMVLSDLPNFPVAASDDLNIAWQILLSGLPQAGPTLGPTVAPTITATPIVTATTTLQATAEPSAAP
jgi:predicted RNase H-like nuclease (RuvC/YqgF family)